MAQVGIAGNVTGPCLQISARARHWRRTTTVMAEVTALPISPAAAILDGRRSGCRTSGNGNCSRIAQVTGQRIARTTGAADRMMESGLVELPAIAWSSALASDGIGATHMTTITLAITAATVLRTARKCCIHLSSSCSRRQPSTMPHVAITLSAATLW